MAKSRKSKEEELIASAVDTIMTTIHVAATRLADRYELRLMQEVRERIDSAMEANGIIRSKTGEILQNRLEELDRV